MMSTNFDRAANAMLRNNLTLYLSLTLKRMPTEEEIFEEFMCMMDGKIKTDLEYRADAFASQHYKPDWPSKTDMTELGYWPQEKDDDEKF
jgi:hypothetical protein